MTPVGSADRHTASRGMRRQERRVARNRNETFQQVNSVIVAIHQSSINYIFLVDESCGNDRTCMRHFVVEICNVLLDGDTLSYRGSECYGRPDQAEMK